jgi:hypothetical protein
MGQSQDDNNFNVIFRVSGKGVDAPPITIQCQANEKVSSIISRYRNKSGDTEVKKKFIFNAKVLNPSLTASESGLANNSTIHVINLKGLEGAMGPAHRLWLRRPGAEPYLPNGSNLPDDLPYYGIENQPRLCQWTDSHRPTHRLFLESSSRALYRQP